jgi:hypothetical protein
VGAEVADVPPSAFVAVTRARIVLPTSTPLRVYVRLVAPLIAEQPLPLGLQRSHWYVKFVPAPVQVPLLVVSVWLC